MPRQKNDAFEALFDELQDQDFLDDLVAGEEDFLSVEEDLPDFKPTPLNFTEWVNAYSPALVPAPWALGPASWFLRNGS